MDFLLILVLWCSYFVQIIETRMYRLQPNDEFYPYSIDKSVPALDEYFNIDNIIFEHIDDDTVKIGGYGVCVKSLDPRYPMEFSMRTQYLDKGAWVEGPIRLILKNFCTEAVNPTRFFYNITKLFTSCPAKKGDKYWIETQNIHARVNLPPSIPIVPWRGYVMITQGLVGAVTKFGFGIQVELFDD